MMYKAFASFILPYPISAHRYYKKFRNKIVISNDGVAYRDNAIEQIKKQLIIQHKNPYEKCRSIWFESVLFSMIVFPPNRAQFDLDNVIKPMQDIFQTARVIRDDSQIDMVVAQKGEIYEGGACIVHISATQEGIIQRPRFRDVVDSNLPISAGHHDEDKGENARPENVRP